MKKLKILFFIFVMLCTTKVYALENNNGIEIDEFDYSNLLNLGFTELEILNMSLEEFENNKNLSGRIVYQRVYPTMIPYSNGSTITEYKTMIMTIIKINNQYRYKVSLEWKKNPKVRSYDIIGIGIPTNVRVDTNSIYFQQNYCTSSTDCTTNKISTLSSTSTGVTSVFQLPSGFYTTLNSYLYFNVSKNTNSIISRLYAYGDYAHAVKNISLANAKRHNINSNGIVLNNTIIDYYDAISTAVATYNTSW